MLPGMRITAVVGSGPARAAPRSLGARALCTLLGMLGAACGASASERVEERPTEAALPLAPDMSNAPARRSGDADETGPMAPAEESTLIAAPSIPLVPPPGEPADPQPLPSAELDTTRPLDTLAPAEVIIPPGDCRFEFLGEWVRCENAGWPNVLETDASDLVTCMQQCLEEEACTAVTDYLWLGQPGLGCYLYLSTCDEPAFASARGEQDAGRDFRRSCSDP
jgi:hypothetical protein